MVADAQRTTVERDGLHCRLWFGPGLITDYRRQAERPLLAFRGCHAVGGFEVPSIPEPYHEPLVPLARVYADHREQFHADMARMLLGLHEPVMWRGSMRERLLAVTTYDLRIVNDLQRPTASRVRFYILFKSFVPIDRVDDEPAAHEAAIRQTLHAARLCRAQSPPTLPLRPLLWPEDGASTDRVLGLDGDFSAFGELRRENCLTTLRTEIEYQKFCEALHAQQFFAAAEPWPPAVHDLAATTTFMAQANERVLLSVRLQPTVRTQGEHAALLDFLDQMRNDDSLKRQRPRHVRRLLARVWRSRELFQACVSTAGQSENTVRDLLATLASEFTFVWNQDGADDEETLGPKQRPARLSALSEREVDLARFNLFQIEQLPWGAVSEKVLAASLPSGAPRGLPSLHTFAPNDEMRLPDRFVQRDLETNPQFVRFRRLLTLREAASIWRLPLASRIGSWGFTCSLPNPFAPPVVITNGEPSSGLTLGAVVHRGLRTDQRWAVSPFAASTESPALCDHAVVVAGGIGNVSRQYVVQLLRDLCVNVVPSAALAVFDFRGGGQYRALSSQLPGWQTLETQEAIHSADTPLPQSFFPSFVAGLRLRRTHSDEVLRRLDWALATSPADEPERTTWRRLSERVDASFGDIAHDVAAQPLALEWGLLKSQSQVLFPLTVAQGESPADHRLWEIAPGGLTVGSMRRAHAFAWLSSRLQSWPRERPAVIVLDGLAALESLGDGSRDGSADERAVADLIRSSAGASMQRLFILVDDAPPLRRYAERFARQLLPMHFSPHGATAMEELAGCVPLLGDQRQYVERAMAGDEFVTVDLVSRTPLVLRTAPAT